MNVIHSVAELHPGPHPISLAIGFFDGVHLGHQQILHRTLAGARAAGGLSIAVTFDRHPNTVVAPQRVPPLIYSLAQKIRAIESLSIDALLVLHFDAAFSRQTGDAFIRGLARDLGKIHSLCVGSDFTFGYKRSGNVALLSRLGAELGFAVQAMAPVMLDGAVISSTRIREAIRAGNLATAARLLGRPYSLAARVVEGDHLGRRLGFPTANLDTAGLALPPKGVYAARAVVQAQTQPAVVNIGFRPTLKEPKPSLHVEVHLLEWTADVYGEELEIFPTKKLRDEKRFDSLDELKAQIARDVDLARAESRAERVERGEREER